MKPRTELLLASIAGMDFASARDAGVIVFLVPVHLVSEANVASHRHWRERDRRVDSQKSTVELYTGAALRSAGVDGSYFAAGALVTLTRIASTKLDTDNAVSSVKHCRDAIAKVIGIDDRIEAVRWETGQRKPGESEKRDLLCVFDRNGHRRYYGLEVRMEKV